MMLYLLLLDKGFCHLEVIRSEVTELLLFLLRKSKQFRTQVF